MDREMMQCFIPDTCCRGMSEKDRRKMKDLCEDMAGRFPPGWKKGGVSSFMKHCFSISAADKTPA